MLAGSNTLVLDLVTRLSPEACRHCGTRRTEHLVGTMACVTGHFTQFEPVGWKTPSVLGLSIGCYYDYQDATVHWFDPSTLPATVRTLVDRQPLLVSFHGLQRSFPVMHDVCMENSPHRGGAAFTVLYRASYDIFDQIGLVDPSQYKEWTLYSLPVLAQANGYGAKVLDDSLIPMRWSLGRYAKVLNACQTRVGQIKGLFETIITTGHLRRGDGLPMHLPLPCGYAVDTSAHTGKGTS